MAPQTAFDRSRGLPPELEVLRLCARSRTDERTDARLHALLSGSLDWERLVRLGWINRLIPLVHWHATRLGVALPEATAAHLHETHRRNLERGRRMAERLATLAGAFAQAGIPAIAFKGPTLEAQAFAHPGLRDCADLDFLFKEADLPALVALLAKHGYELAERLSAVEERVFRSYHFAYEFNDGSGLANLDAHWRLLPSIWTIPLDYEGLWRRSRTTEIGGTAVRVFCDEDLLFYLALHGAKEKWLRLRMVCDVAELLHARPELDWDEALERAGAQGGRRILLLAAHLAAAWLGAPVPERVLARAAADRRIPHLEEELWQAFRRGDDDMSRLFEMSAFRLQVLDRLRDRLSYVFRLATTPRLAHTKIARLPAPLVAGYVPLKLVHDYVAIPAWKLAQHLGASSGRSRARAGSDAPR